MSETFVCARCHQEFVVDCPENSEETMTIIALFHETEPVCNECEHGFLAWGGCHPVI